MFYFYIFRCKDTTLYCGWTNDLQKREMLHNTGKGATYTRIHGQGKIVYSEQFKTKPEAMRREYQVKQYTKKQKESLIAIKKRQAR